MSALTLTLTMVLAVTVWFLGMEMLKKFVFMREFILRSLQHADYNYSGGRPRMGNIVLRSRDGRQFSALIGFDLEILILGYIGFDPYGFVVSDEQGVAVISTYLGRGPCLFQFLLTIDGVEASSSLEDQKLTPHVTYPPHWYQRIGFYG